MSNCGGKECTDIPKVEKAVDGSIAKVGTLEGQEYSDKVHFHDRKKKLRFEYLDKVGLQMANDNLQKIHHELPIGCKCLIPGTETDLVFERHEAGWTNEVVKKGSVTDAVILGDPVLIAFDKFCQRLA